jgi:hypothetical protein
MSNYFSYYPKIDYDINDDGNTHNVVDITRHFITKRAINDRTAVFYDYDIKDGDRPDTIAQKYYGESDYDWVVLLLNNIIDPQYDWPLNYRNFEKFIIAKYGSVATAQSTVHHYERIVRAKQYNTKGDWIKEDIIEVDLTSYNALVAANRKSVDSYTYEKTVNEAKRSIKLLDKKHLERILSEAETVFD